eukprot:TRINITY_DN10090_c0_g1_i5.p1 TRINITY_DN10090_c0_g1~~TRINITY_DN10090_c0_g1_i5.p1  ORF type:complete len:105 (+),score=13.70 TRINITY_DN10090_c0_g1_i5:696-1010(+)
MMTFERTILMMTFGRHHCQQLSDNHLQYSIGTNCNASLSRPQQTVHFSKFELLLVGLENLKYVPHLKNLRMWSIPGIQTFPFMNYCPNLIKLSIRHPHQKRKDE